MKNSNRGKRARFFVGALGYLFRIYIGIGVTAVLLLPAPAIQAQETAVPIDIPAQPLGEALKQLSRQTPLQLFYTPDLVAGKNAPAVRGKMSLPQALDGLLKDSGLEYRSSGTSVTLQPSAPRPAPEAKAPPEPPITLPQVTVQDQRDQGYAVKQSSTATKTDTPIMEVPQSIQIIPRQLLDDQKIIQLSDAVKNVSGVNVPHYGGSSSETFTIRGFPVSENVFRNGFRDNWFAGSQRTSTDMFNLDRIEILKGPSSVLYGNLDPGGTVHFVTKQPLAQPYYAGEFTGGSYRFYRPTVDISGPLNADNTFRYRLNGGYEYDGNFRQLIHSERGFVAPVFSWSPRVGTTITLEGEYLNDQRPIDRGLVAVGTGVARIPISRFLGDPDRKRDIDQGLVNLRLNHEFNSTFSLNAGYRYAAAHDTYESIEAGFLDADNRTLNLWAFKLPQEFQAHQLQADLISNFHTGSIAHTVLFGTEMMRATSDGKVFGDFAAGTMDIYNPVYAFANPALALLGDGTRRSHALGVYLQDQIKLFDSLTLVGGARFDLVDRKAHDRIGGATTKASDQQVSPRVGLVYRPIEPVSLYASWARGFQPQFGTLVFDGAQSFKPEESEQYEVGVKTEFLGGRFTSTLAFFHLTKQNVLTEIPGIPFSQIPVGEQRSRGMEFDMTARIIPGWNVIASYALIDAKVTKDNTPIEGNQLNNVPKNSGSLWTTYEVQDGRFRGIGFGAGIFAAGQRQGDLNNSFDLPGYIRADAAIFYRAQHFNAAVNFKNLFDKKYYEGAQFRESIIPGAPFTVLATIGFKF